MAADEVKMKNYLVKDALGRRTVITVARGGRPHDHAKERPQKTVPPEKCFFCAGNEHLTPPEIDRTEKGGKWEIRVFPNKFPAFFPESKRAYGRHEVIVETPDHQKTLSELSAENLADYLSMVKKRVQSAYEDPKIEYASMFKNEGKAAGASLEHSHSQLVGMPFVPALVKRLQKKTAAFAKMEKSEAKNMVAQNSHFFAFCPKASRFHFEVWILPKQQASSIIELDSSGISALAEILKEVLAAIDASLGYPPYNIVFHNAPKGVSQFPFHLEILPRISLWAGFELGTEVTMVSNLPRDAAEILRNAAKKAQ